MVAYPGETYQWYGGVKKEIELYDYKETQCYSGLEWGTFHCSNEVITKKILSVHPEYKYLLKKVKFDGVRFNIHKLLNCMQMWKEHPSEVEALVSCEFYDLAVNKNLYRLKKENKKKIINALKEFINHDPVSIEPPLVMIQRYVKSGMKFDEWYTYMCWNNWSKYHMDSIETFRYCQRKNIDRYRYHDMLDMAKAQGHNIEDQYWKYPNDPNKMHDELLAIKLELQRIQREKEFEPFWRQLEKIAKRNKLNESIDIGNGYKLFMPVNYEQYALAANVLHQCILSSKYYEKVAKGQCLLLMIWKDNKPSSTCQIDFNKKILQFYGNEAAGRGSSSIYPTDYERNAMDKFLLNFKPKKVAFKEANSCC